MTLSNRRRVPKPASVLVSFAIGLASALAPTAHAQPTTGTVLGLVRDVSGAVVPEAEVTLVGPGAAPARVTHSGPDGSFVFALVPPGAAVLEARASGFKVARVGDVQVEVGRASTATIVVSPGSFSESVSVSARDAIDAAAPAPTTSVETRLVQALPSFTRQALDLARLAPGVDALATPGQLIGVEGGSLLTNGLRRTQNTYFLDGAENSSAWRNVALQFPNPDTIQEVQVQGTNAGAQFGEQPGAVVNIVTRSGTNAFHGTGFHFFHDERLNANTWVNNRQGLAKPKDEQRYTGVVVGGPVVRDRTFFFGSFNRFTNNTSQTQRAGRFPTEAMKRGDFSEVPDFIAADGRAIPFDIKDPVTGASLGRHLPRSAINPASSTLLELLPSAGEYYDVAVRQYDQPVHNDEYLLKIDDRLAGRHQVSGTLFVARGAESDPGQWWAGNQVPEWGAMERRGRQTSTFAKHTWMTSPSFSLETRFSLVESSSYIDPGDESRGFADLGIAFPFQPFVNRLPSIRLDGQGGFRADHATADYIGQRNHRVGSTAVWTRGRHLVTFGADTQVDWVEFDGNRELRTSFYFTGRDTLNGPLASASQVPLSANNFGTQNFAYAWADFLLGRVERFDSSGYWHTESRARSYAAFVQDEWRLRPTVTLSAGLRYEYAFPAQEQTGVSGGVFILGHRSSQYPSAPESLAWDGDAGVPPGYLRKDKNNFAPRLGLAWDVTGRGRDIVRAAAGVHYAFVPLAGRINSGPSGFGGAWSSGANALLNDPFGTSKVNPYDAVPQYGPHNPLPDAIVGYTPDTFPWNSLFQTQVIRGIPTRVYVGGIIGYDPEITTPFVTEFNVTYERVLRRGWSAAAAYVGNRGRHQPMWQAFNAPVPADGGNTSAQSMRDRRPLATYGGGRLYSTILDSTYDALQTWTDVRLAGLTLRASYVLARARSPFGINAQSTNWPTADGFSAGTASAESIFNTASDAGQSTYPYDIDRDRAENGRRHTGKVHFAYGIPWRDSGRRWDWLLGGWTISGAFVALSGLPLNVVWGMDANADGSGADRPGISGRISYPSTPVPNASPDRRGAIQYLDPTVFVGPCGTPQRSGSEAFCTTPGTLERNAVRGVPVFNTDLAVIKTTGLAGGMRLELRLEIFNVTNSNFLGTPDLNLGSPFFGQVTSRIHTPRQMQVGLKVHF